MSQRPNEGLDERVGALNTNPSPGVLRSEVAARFGKVGTATPLTLTPVDASRSAFLGAMATLYGATAEQIERTLRLKGSLGTRLQRMEEAWTSGLSVKCWPEIYLELDGKTTSGSGAP